MAYGIYKLLNILMMPFIIFPFQSGIVCDCTGDIVDRDINGVVVCDPNIPEPGILRVTVTATTNEDFYVNITALNSRAKSSSLSNISEFSIQ